MAKIHYMKDKDGNTIYPVTHADAILGLEDVGSNVDLSSYQTKVDNNLATQSKDLVGAINELFQSADSGKQLIANAIGEPVSADDTFSAMSNDINSLLSTFKTNMMNNGITVESGDKFKQLINKISTMAEEGKGKGLQFVSGEYVLTEILYAYNTTTTFNINLDFNPNYMIVYIPNLTPLNTGYYNQPDVVLTTDCMSMEIAAWYGSEYNYRGPKFNLSYDQNTITIYIARGATGYNLQIPEGTAIKWYAIGVGEDSISGGLDVISATELPTTGKDNQVCIISNNPDKNIILTSNSSEAITDTSFVVISSGSGTAIPVIAGNLTTHYYISEVRDNVNLLSSYYWSNNEWKKLTGAMTVLLKNGTFYNDSIHGGLTSGSRASYTAGTGIMLRSYYYSEDTWSYMFTYVTLNTRINLSLYNKIELDLQLESAAPNYNTNFNLYKSSITTNKEYSQDGGTPSGMSFIQGTTITLKPNEITTISFDLTNHNDTAYLCFNHIIGYNVFIKGIRLYHN